MQLPGPTPPPTTEGASPSLERRTLLRASGAAGAAGIAVAALAACSSSSSTPPSTGGASTSTADTAMSEPSASASAGSDGSGSGSGTALGAASQVPVGGGMIFSAQKVVVTQPTAGTFKAFSATCTHMGCQVSQIADGRIKCPCHGSQYSITDGSVQAGPAPAPLPAQKVTMQGGQLFVSS